MAEHIAQDRHRKLLLDPKPRFLHRNRGDGLRGDLLRTGFSYLFLALIALLLLTPSQAARAQTPEPPASQNTEAYCLSCHSRPGISMTLPSGETLPLSISPDDLSHSVHSPLGIECQACHTDITTYPHPPISFQTRRELSLDLYQACQKCHQEQYAQAQDGIHGHAALEGNPNAPVCTDCHGAHYVTPPNEPRAKVSNICGQCHQTEFDQYKNSIHGSALIGEDNPDVPVCTDCHGVHNIADPHAGQFVVETPELCAGCHANEELMSKYGISSKVYDLYRISWHGTDVSVFRARWPNLWHNTAVCTDCHGVHDILPAKNPASHVNATNLLGTCQNCHAEAPPNFVSAWTGHYEISRQKTPYVYYTKVFYDSFTNFILWLSAIYVIFQIIRNTIARARRSL